MYVGLIRFFAPIPPAKILSPPPLKRKKREKSWSCFHFIFETSIFGPSKAADADAEISRLQRLVMSRTKAHPIRQGRVKGERGRECTLQRRSCMNDGKIAHPPHSSSSDNHENCPSPISWTEREKCSDILFPSPFLLRPKEKRWKKYPFSLSFSFRYGAAPLCKHAQKVRPKEVPFGRAGDPSSLSPFPCSFSCGGKNWGREGHGRQRRRRRRRRRRRPFLAAGDEEEEEIRCVDGSVRRRRRRRREKDREGRGGPLSPGYAKFTRRMHRYMLNISMF